MAQIGDLFNPNWIAVFRFLLPSERTLALLIAGGGLEHRVVRLRLREGPPGRAADHLQPAAGVCWQQFLLGNHGVLRRSVRLRGQPFA